MGTRTVIESSPYPTDRKKRTSSDRVWDLRHIGAEAKYCLSIRKIMYPDLEEVLDL